MKAYSLLIYCLFFLTVSLELKGQELSQEVRNDSLILAQAYINLSLTEKYFETLSLTRISKIIPFEESELASITDSSFINKNSKLYNFTYSLLYLNKAKFLFDHKENRNRKTLVELKKDLHKAISYFELSDQDDNYSNSFYHLINFTGDSFKNLHFAVFEMKRKSGTYFNNNIYPDFIRIFNSKKTSDKSKIDSLFYYAKIYDLELNPTILNHGYNAKNYNFGPKTLNMRSTYKHTERNYDYSRYDTLSNQKYLIDPKLDLISRYLQLKYIASKKYKKNLNWFNLYKIYNTYNIFVEDLDYYFYVDSFNSKNDLFFKKKLNKEAYKKLLRQLRNKFPYDSFILAQSYINLSIMNLNFSQLSSQNASKILTTEANELRFITDDKMILQNTTLYEFTLALLYSNTTKLLYRDKIKINRVELVRWKSTLEKGITSFNRSQKENLSVIKDGQDAFYKLIKFPDYSESNLRTDIINLKKEFVPYFNDDIYTEFKRIFYTAKKTGYYDFDSLVSYADIYNLSLELSILNNNGNNNKELTYPFIELEYILDEKLGLISRYLQLKYLASKKDVELPDGLSLEKLYNEYYHLKWDIRDFNDVFFEIELNAEALELLYKELQAKYPPYNELQIVKNLDVDEVDVQEQIVNSIEAEYKNEMAVIEKDLYYFFPHPAPKASANLTVSNYQPTLTVLSDVDNHISGILNTAGYKDQLHYYYYYMDGFALATSLEKFNTDGSNIDDDERWMKKLGTEGKFSYYEIFKSLFFETESEFRMFAFIVASKNVTMSDAALPVSMAEQLMQNSYDTLPKNLKNKTLINKDLTVLVYHFHQNNIGEVPMLDITGSMNALEHLRIAGLDDLVKN